MFELRVDLQLPKGLAKQLAGRTESEWVIELLRPRAHWKHVAKAIAKEARTALKRLVLRDRSFDPGASIGRAMLTAKASDALWQALPALEELELVGHAWAPTLDHPGLRELTMSGFGFTGSFLKKPANAPALAKLTWGFAGDHHGVALGAAGLKGLFGGEGLDSLVELDLANADMDGSLLRSKTFTGGALLPRLKAIVLPVASSDPALLSKKESKHLAHLERVEVTDPSAVELDPRFEPVEPEQIPMTPERSAGGVRFWGVNDERVDAFVGALRAVGPIGKLTLLSHDIRERTGELGTALREQETLEELSLADPRTYGLPAEALEPLARAIEGHPALRTLNLHDNRLSGGVEPLDALVRALPALTTLHLSSAKLEEDLESLVAVANGWTGLRALAIGGNGDGEKALPLGGLALPALERLDLRRTGKLTESIVAELFGGGGERLPALKALTLGSAYGRTPEPAALAAIRAALGEWSALEELALDYGRTSFDALPRLADGVPGLRALRLKAFNPDKLVLDADLGQRLGALVAELSALEELALTAMPFDLDGVTAFAKAIADHPSLRTVAGIELKNTDDASAAADALATTPLDRLAPVGRAFTGALAAADAVRDLELASSRHLEKLVTSLPLGDAKSLTTLRVRGGLLDDEVLKPLAKAVKGHPTLRELHLDGATDAEPMIAFVEALEGSNLTLVHCGLPVLLPVADAIARWTADWDGPKVVIREG